VLTPASSTSNVQASWPASTIWSSGMATLAVGTSVAASVVGSMIWLRSAVEAHDQLAGGDLRAARDGRRGDRAGGAVDAGQQGRQVGAVGRLGHLAGQDVGRRVRHRVGVATEREHVEHLVALRHRVAQVDSRDDARARVDLEVGPAPNLRREQDRRVGGGDLQCPATARVVGDRHRRPERQTGGVDRLDPAHGAVVGEGEPRLAGAHDIEDAPQSGRRDVLGDRAVEAEADQRLSGVGLAGVSARAMNPASSLSSG
jgi:hypothetical protein